MCAFSTYYYFSGIHLKINKMDHTLIILVSIDIIAIIVAVAQNYPTGPFNQISPKKLILPGLILLGGLITVYKEFHDKQMRDEEKQEAADERKRDSIARQQQVKDAQKTSQRIQKSIDSLLYSQGVNFPALLKAVGVSRDPNTGILSTSGNPNVSYYALKKAVEQLKEQQEPVFATPALAPAPESTAKTNTPVIVKQPARQPEPVNKKDAPIHQAESLPDSDLAEKECKTNGINMNDCFGKIRFISRFSEAIELYHISNGSVNEQVSTLISPDEESLTKLIRAGHHDDNGECLGREIEYRLYFRTVNSATTKYGVLAVMPRPCKVITKFLSPKNLLLSPKGLRP